MEFSIFKRRKKVFLGLDIGTEAVKAIVFTRDKGKIDILGFSLRYFDKFGVFDSNQFEMDVHKKAISGVINDLVLSFKKTKTNIGKDASIFLMLPPNVLRARIVSQEFTRVNYENIIDKKEERSIRQLISTKIQKQISQNLEKETGILQDEIKFIGQDILEVKVNGYSVSSILGVNGKFITFKILATFVSKEYFRNVRNIMRSLGIDEFKLVHGAELLSLFLKSDNRPEIQNAVFLDIGGKVTQIFLVNNGKINFINEFSIGGKDFSQSLARSLGITNNRSRFLKYRYSRGLLSENVRNTIKKRFSEVSENWKLNLRSKILDFGGKTIIPSNVFIFGGSSLLPEMKELFSDKHSLADIFPTDNINVKFLYPENICIANEKPKKELDKLKSFLKIPQYTPVSLICYV